VAAALRAGEARRTGAEPDATPAVGPDRGSALPKEPDTPISAAPEAPLPVIANDDSIPAAAPPSPGVFQIADIVARIDAFQRDRDQPDGIPAPSPVSDVFRFETDANGVIRWVDGIIRAALIGLSLDGAGGSVTSRVDGVVAGAFRRRAAFTNARLLIDGTADWAGQWRITGTPAFDRATGRFTGYRGTGRRPRADERADPARDGRTAGTDAVRQLVHELRTPTTAIAGFAELIEGELLGPVPPPYRGYAGTIRHQAMDLLGAIDDLDTAARLDSNALALRDEVVTIKPVIDGIIADLAPLTGLRQCSIAMFVPPDLQAHADQRAVERLIGRLLATMLAAAARDEQIMLTATAESADQISITVDRPRALAVFSGDAILSADSDLGEDDGAPLLGTGFALRLVRNLAVELGGSLAINEDRLTLRLPAAVTRDVGQASTN
jgi:signal transduction histidine kinase